MGLYSLVAFLLISLGMEACASLISNSSDSLSSRSAVARSAPSSTATLTYSTVQYSTVQYSTVQYSTVHRITHHVAVVAAHVVVLQSVNQVLAGQTQARLANNILTLFQFYINTSADNVVTELETDISS